MRPISIVLADAQYLIRVGLRHLIDRIADFEIVGEAEDEMDLKHLLQEKAPDVVILDHLQTDKFGVDILKKVKIFSPKTKVLIISSDDNKSNVYDVIEAGVHGFLTKQCDEEEILNAVRATAKGEKFFCSKVLNFILEKSFAKDDDCAPSILSPRECQVVSLIVQGKIAKEIAAELNLSTHTIYTHRKNIMKKLKLSSASELVLYAVNNGMVPES